MLIWDVLKSLGVRWSRPERARRLFGVCVQVQARLMARHPGYRSPQVHHIPPALVDEVKEILRDILSRQPARPQHGTGPGAAPEPDSGL